jgi:hypothetical protein
VGREGKGKGRGRGREEGGKRGRGRARMVAADGSSGSLPQRMAPSSALPLPCPEVLGPELRAARSTPEHTITRQSLLFGRQVKRALRVEFSGSVKGRVY